ncbi:hypothetical protein NN561_012905 [Cricetulus griseus]
MRGALRGALLEATFGGGRVLGSGARRSAAALPLSCQSSIIGPLAWVPNCQSTVIAWAESCVLVPAFTRLLHGFLQISHAVAAAPGAKSNATCLSSKKRSADPCRVTTRRHLLHLDPCPCRHLLGEACRSTKIVSEL